MDDKEFRDGVILTESSDFDEILKRVTPEILRLLHASFGLVTESGEFADSVKKYLFYGREIDNVNLIEELGDMLWYIIIACESLGVTISQVKEINNKKLRSRYPEKFCSKNANDRDLKLERKVLRDTINSLLK